MGSVSTNNPFVISLDSERRNTNEFSIFSTDTDSIDDDIESEFLNYESLTSSKPSRLRTPQKIHSRTSIRMIPDESKQRSLFKSRYSHNMLMTSYKNSSNSLNDITNMSTMSFLDRTHSKSSLGSIQGKRYYSLTDNASSLSLEQKRNKIIKRLNKRNSKNLSNPYFYQYKQNNQPKQPPPVPSESFDFDDSFQSNYTSFSIQDQNFTEESLNFVDSKVVVNAQYENNRFNIGTSKHTSSPNNLQNNADNNDNSRDYENRNEYEYENGNENNDDDDDDDNSRNYNNNTSQNSHNTSSNTSHSNNNNNNSNNTNNGSDIIPDTSTSSNDNTTSTDENDLSRRIRQSQRLSTGIFSETLLASPSKDINGRPKFENKSQQQNTLNSEFSSSIIVDDVSKSRDSIETVSTTNLQLNQFSSNNRTKDEDYHIKNSWISDISTNSNVLQGVSDSLTEPILTMNNMNVSGETRIKNFNLNNNSTVSVLSESISNPKFASKSETPLVKSNSDISQSKLRPNKTNKLPIRKPPPESFQMTKNVSSENRILPNNINKTNIGDPSSVYINSTNGSGIDDLQRIPSSKYLDTVHDRRYHEDSDQSNTSGLSNGSQKMLLPESRMNKKVDLRRNFQDGTKLEKGISITNSDYNMTYYDYTLNERCSDFVSLLFLFFSILAPPFWLLIALGFLDKAFGKFDRKYKIASFVAFGIFCIGTIIGIAVGFGYGLTH